MPSLHERDDIFNFKYRYQPSETLDKLFFSAWGGWLQTAIFATAPKMAGAGPGVSADAIVHRLCLSR